MAAAPVKVYGPPSSLNVSRVLACLVEKDVPFELVPINMAKGEHKKPDYLKIQPFGQVPAFQDDSITLFESRAISRYICDKYANQGNKELYGTNPLVKASIDKWLEVEGRLFNPASSDLVFQLAFAPKMNIKQNKKLIDLSIAKLVEVLEFFNWRLGESRYLAGADFTLADLSHLPNSHHLMSLADIGKLFKSRKNVARWLAEISNRESWKKVVEMQNSPLPTSA